MPLIYGNAVCETEKVGAKKLLAQKEIVLTELNYYQKYTDLCSDEMNLWNRPFRKIAMLGSGALPFSSFLLAMRNPGTKLVCVEYDRESYELSIEICKRLGLTE